MHTKRLQELKLWIGEKAGDTPYGCLILHQDQVLAEGYGGGFSARSVFEIGSIRKSFNSALIGIGIKDGIVDLNAKAVDFWPELIEISKEDGDRAISLHQLASGTSGWLTPDPPGTAFLYNNAAFTASERVGP